MGADGDKKEVLARLGEDWSGEILAPAQS